MQNHSEIAEFLWKIADSLYAGGYEEADYEYVIHLMVKLVFEPDRSKLAREKLIAIYDPTCGTGGMLTTASGEEFGTLLRRNLGKKRYEISEDQSAAILGIYEAFGETKVSKIFDTTDFGYTKVCVERPLWLRYDLTPEQRNAFKLDKEFLKLVPTGSSRRKEAQTSPAGAAIKSQSRLTSAATSKGEDDRAAALADALDTLAKKAPWRDDFDFLTTLEDRLGFTLTGSLVKTLRSMLGTRDEQAEPVREIANRKSKILNPVIPDSDLRDFENVPLKEDIDEYFRREVIPHVPDAWMDRSKDKVGYEISFTKYFYEYTPLRSTAEIATELLKLDEETENLLRGLLECGDMSPLSPAATRRGEPSADTSARAKTKSGVLPRHSK